MREPIDHPLEGPYLKVGRAKEHFDALRREVTAFDGREPYERWLEYEDYTDEVREYTVFAVVEEEPPSRLGVIAGDVIQNLRSALDHLVWAYTGPGLRGTDTGFPIVARPRNFEASAAKRIPGVSEAVRALIERSQPYHWGSARRDHPLFILKNLSNIDKHRTLLPVALARRNEYVTRPGSVEVFDLTVIPTRVVQDPTEVMTFVTRGEPPDEVNVEAYLTFEVTFEGRTLRDFESIFEFIGLSILDQFDRS